MYGSQVQNQGTPSSWVAAILDLKWVCDWKSMNSKKGKHGTGLPNFGDGTKVEHLSTGEHVLFVSTK